MAQSDYMSSDDFAQKLRELGYLPSEEKSSAPQNEEENAALQPPASSPAPSNEGAAEEFVRSQDPNYKQEFPEPTPASSSKSSEQEPDMPPKEPDTSYPAPGSPQSPTGPTPSPAPNAAAPQPQPTSLSQNPELNDEALKNAQNQVQNRQLFTGIGDALATAAAAPTGKAPDEAFFKEQMQNAQAPVQNLEARRQLFERNVLVAGQTADAAVKQMNAQQQAELNKPNSAPSQFIKSLLASQYGQQTDAQGNKVDITKSPGWDQLSGSDALDFQKMIASQEHMQTLRDQLQFRNQQSQTKVDTHTSDKSNAATQKLSQQLNTFRGDTAAQQANVGLLSSDKAMALINSTPDLNNLNEQQYALLRAEVAKIATGGAATAASTHDIQAQTLQSKAAKFWQSVSGQPTGAQLGQFIQQNKDYLQHLNDVNHQYIDGKRQNILNDYKGQIPEDVYNDFQSRYLPNRKEGEGNMPAQSNQGGQSTQASLPTPQGKIKVSNGNQSFFIDPSHLADAQKDGYKQVQ